MMESDLFEYISLFEKRFKKTKVVNEEMDDETYHYLVEKHENYANFVKKEGFCSYENGLFSTINPLKYKRKLEANNIENLYGGDPIVMTGFGDFIFSDLTHGPNSFYYSFYDECYNCGSKVGEIFTNDLLDNEHQKESMKKKLFKQAIEKFGVLSHDQLFSFPMDFPWANEKDLEKIENVVVYSVDEYLKLIALKHNKMEKK